MTFTKFEVGHAGQDNGDCRSGASLLRYRRRALVVSIGIATAMGLAISAQQASAQTTATPAPASPQTPAVTKSATKPTKLQTIQVLGSHIRAAALATANPTITVSAEQIEQTGDLSLGDVLRNMPALVGSVSSPDLNNGGSDNGGVTLGIHGLGAARTLVLVNGQRVLNKNLNAIPAAAIQEVQVLTNGASSIYGSDAIGGVIDFILKTGYNGAQVQTTFGISGHGDGQEDGGSFVFGKSSDKGSLLAGVSYNKTDPIPELSRKFSRQTLSVTGSTNTPIHGFVGGDTFAERGFITVPSTIAAHFGCNQLSLNKSALGQSGPTTLADFHCFNPTNDAEQDSVFDNITQPQSHTNGFINGVYHITPNIDATITVLHNVSKGQFNLTQPLWTTLLGSPISQYSMYNPFGVDFTQTSGNQTRIALGDGNLGVRSQATSDTTDEGLFALRGNMQLLGHHWNWDIGYDEGRESDQTTFLNYPNLPLMAPGVGPSMLVNGVPTCVSTPGDASTAIAGCTPWDPFNTLNPVDEAALLPFMQQGVETTLDMERIKYGDITGGLFDLPAGTAQFALGLSWRTEYTHSVVPPALLASSEGTCTFGTGCASPMVGGFSVKEAYSELFLPLVKDLPLIHSLSVDIGDRYSKFSDFGSTNNWKVGLSYRPFQDLLLRGTVAKVFRAPTLENIFAPAGFGSTFLSKDPCDGITTPNPACVGVPTNGTFSDEQVARHEQLIALGSGAEAANFPLGPENGKSFDFGVVYSPMQIQGLSLTADLWHVYLRNVITNVNAQTVLDACFTGISKFCPLITRLGADTGSPGEIVHFLLPTVNLGRLDVKGLDFQASYKLPMLPIGQISTVLSGTYMDYENLQTAPGLASNVVVGAAGKYNGDVGLGLIPRIRAQGIVNWQKGRWVASWRLQYIGPWSLGSGQVSRGYSAVPGFKNPVALHYGSSLYSDVQAGYSIWKGLRVNAGVNNLFNRQPPIFFNSNLPASTNGNTDGNYFDVIGRYYWLRLTYSM